jgi:hypothetical protein
MYICNICIYYTSMRACMHTIFFTSSPMAAWDIIPESLLMLPSIASVRLTIPRELLPFNCRSNSLASFSAAAARSEQTISDLLWASLRMVDWRDRTGRGFFFQIILVCVWTGIPEFGAYVILKTGQEQVFLHMERMIKQNRCDVHN